VTLRDGRVLMTFISCDGAETAEPQTIEVPWERTQSVRRRLVPHHPWRQAATSHHSRPWLAR
jgi:hypothetical protein